MNFLIYACKSKLSLYLIISKNELRKSHFEVFIGAFSEIRAAIFIPLKLVILARG